MKQIQPDEKQFSKFFRDRYTAWCERIEPALGMSPGIPDLVLLTPSGFVFAELKIGSIVDGVLWTSEIRPAQIAWHKRVALSGGMSFFAVGVWSGDTWRVFAFDGLIGDRWEASGYRLGSDAIELSTASLEASVADYVAYELE